MERDIDWNSGDAYDFYGDSINEGFPLRALPLLVVSFFYALLYSPVSKVRKYLDSNRTHYT